MSDSFLCEKVWPLYLKSFIQDSVKCLKIQHKIISSFPLLICVHWFALHKLIFGRFRARMNNKL